MRKGFHLTLDEGLKRRAVDYCDRQMPRLSLSNLIHKALFHFLEKEDNQCEEVEK